MSEQWDIRINETNIIPHKNNIIRIEKRFGQWYSGQYPHIEKCTKI